jgi:hypothetical protein
MQQYAEARQQRAQAAGVSPAARPGIAGARGRAAPISGARPIMITGQQAAARQRDKFVPLPEDEEEGEEEAAGAAMAMSAAAATAAAAVPGAAVAAAPASLESLEGGLAMASQLSDAVVLGEDLLQVRGREGAGARCRGVGWLSRAGLSASRLTAT